MTATISMTCPRHKSYKAERYPTSECPMCYGIWDMVKRARDHVNFGASHIRFTINDKEYKPKKWDCPIKQKDCTKNCGSYGCRN